MKRPDWTPEAFRGTPLREQDIPQGRVISTTWHPHIRYAWDTGIAIGRYLQELKRGRIIGTRCGFCKRTVVPPRIVCEQCFRPMMEWSLLKDTGTVNTFSICYVTWDAKRVPTPEIPAVIEIDGASPGCGIMHLLGEVDPKKVHRGMRVQAVWRPQRGRIGAITDIRYFRPI